MNITQSFILRLSQMKDNGCGNFLKEHKDRIDFGLLISKAKEMMYQELSAGENETAENIAAVIGDATLFAAISELPKESIHSTFNL